MKSVKKFNGLHGAQVSREEIERILRLAHYEEQYNVSDRLEKILVDNPNENKFELNIAFPAVNQVPNSVLNGIEFDNEEHLQGLGKAVTSQDIYNNITDLMINTIKQVGYLPWQKEWIGSGIIGARNFVTGKPYSGINFFTLNYVTKHDADGKPYLVAATQEPQYYLTFNQISDYGAKIKKGSKAREVIYYNFILNYKDEKVSFSGSDANKFGTFAKQNNLTEAQVQANLKRIPILKYYNVFNANDCEGLPAPKKIEKVINTNEYAQFIIDNYPNKPGYRFGSDKAFYSPVGDYVSMPLISAFRKESSYYSTYFHEITHSTGHPSRLMRDMSGRFGNEKYAFEELIAELGATYLCSETGILFETIDNSAKYLKGWSKKLISKMEEDNKFFMKAAAAAQKAVKYILDDSNPNRPRFKDITKKPVKKDAQTPAKPTNKAIKSTAKSEKTIKTAVTNVPKPKTYFVAKSKQPGKIRTKKETIVIDNSKPKVDEKTKQISLFGTKKPKPLKGVDLIGNVLGNMIANTLMKPNEKAPKNSLADRLANKSNVAREYYNIPNKDIADFFGKIEKKTKESVAITIAGGQGSGKTRLCFQLMNCFAQNYKVGHASIEEHPESALYEDKIHQYLNNKALHNISAPEISTIQDVYDLVKQNDIIIIDSFSKLQEMQKGCELDKDFRKAYDGKLFIIIYQQTTDGKMRGGSKSQFDGDVICFVQKESNYQDNYCWMDKNRYQKKNLEDLKYNIFKGKLIRPEKEKIELTPGTTLNNPNHQFNFKIG